ncbi:hypothetical protein H072_623 [Dactylellina haptotyla CBS 200.50]|uniref:Rhodopsin domain-containing protein n=1 Tax=Dactylellina haptotyla (strain CBS 200.50) TaxID=1284197 RepID=S8ARA8_DACHA|nr:hypothetical protein H072_623 [Dactylellina haptotyla CBS 200.50]
MLLPPLSIILSWPKPNYENPERQGHFMAPLTIVMMVFCGIVVSLRLYVRAFILKAFKADDWLIILATITAMAVSITCILSEPAGVGIHIWDLPQDRVKMVRIWSFATQLTFTWAVSLTKVSILLFYFRFCTTRSFKVSIWITLVFIVAWTITWTFLIIFQCVPVSAYWRLPRSGDKCITLQNELHLLHGSTNLITDVLVLLLPIPTVWRLQMPTRQKITLVGVFTLGIVAPLSAILRLIYIQKATVSWDQSWWCIELWIYTSLETHVAIVCASIPSLKPLAIKIFPRFASSHGYSNNLTPMEFNSSGAGSSAVRGTHSRAQAGNSNHSRAERAAKVRSIYPLTTFGKDERGESQESIVANISESRGSLDIITSFSSGGTPPKVPPRVGMVVKTTEVTRDVTMRDKRRLGDDRNV